MIHNGMEFDTYFKNYPDKDGFFGKYGGAYITEELKDMEATILGAAHGRNHRGVLHNLQIGKVYQRASSNPQGVSG